MNLSYLRGASTFVVKENHKYGSENHTFAATTTRVKLALRTLK